MYEIISIKSLTTGQAVITKDSYIDVNGTPAKVGDTWQRAYVNSTRGRGEVEAEVPEPYRSAIMAVWGAEPTVVESAED